MTRTLKTETIGNATLYLVEDMADGHAPRYHLERTVMHDDGSYGPRVAYGEPGFSSQDEALELGREWCQMVGKS